jgi:hypothetical protein
MRQSATVGAIKPARQIQTGARTTQSRRSPASILWPEDRPLPERIYFGPDVLNRLKRALYLLGQGKAKAATPDGVAALFVCRGPDGQASAFNPSRQKLLRPVRRHSLQGEGLRPAVATPGWWLCETSKQEQAVFPESAFLREAAESPLTMK